MGYKFRMPTRLYFGNGEIENVGQLISNYGSRCFLVTTKDMAPLNQLYTKIKNLLKESGVDFYHFDKVVPNPTVEVVEMGVKELRDYKADVILAIGGGSSIDTAKSIALLKDETVIDWQEIFSTYSDPFGQYKPLSEKKLPLISIPTTAGTGSEVTQAAVISSGEDKNTIFHPDNYSTEAILDPELLLTLPNRLTASTGFDCFSHAFESYINEKASPMSEMLSLEAMRIVIDALPKALEEPEEVKYREQLMHAQMLAGSALANAGASAPHPLSEIIGGITHISHGEALALVFPEFIEAFYDANNDKFNAVAALFGEKDLKIAVEKFLRVIQLYKTKDDYKITDEQYNQIYQSPILGFLPFGSKETLQGIVYKALQKR